MNYKSNGKLRHQSNMKGKISEENPLFKTIEDAYSIFRQGPTEHAVCDCCMDRDIRANFFKHNQRDLPFEYLQDWFFAAADIPMAQASWRFVLPRILEALASGEEPSNTGLEVCLSRYPTGVEGNWNKEEWRVLDQFQRKFLEISAANFEEFLDDYICMFVNAGWPAESLFKQVSDLDDKTLTSRLWNDWCSWGNTSAIWITAFWENASQARSFYLSDELLNRLTNYALDENTSPEMRDKAYELADVIHLKSVL